MGTSGVVRYLELTPVDASRSMPPPRPAARSFRDLLVWRKAHEFVLALYAFTAGFPRSGTYGLSQQMRRAAVSLPALHDRDLSRTNGVVLPPPPDRALDFPTLPDRTRPVPPDRQRIFPCAV